MRKTLTAIALCAGAFSLASAANANTILTFGQTSGSNTVTATANHGATTITGDNVAVDITQILGSVTAPLPAYLNFGFTSDGAAVNDGGGFVSQDFDGTFTITSGTNDTGTNYLSGSFTDAVFGSGASLTLSAADPPETVAFTSSVITDLGDPTGVSLAFANVTPGVSIDPGNRYYGDTLASFTASVSGDFSGTGHDVPEPASMALLGSGLFGLGALRRRRKAALQTA